MRKLIESRSPWVIVIYGAFFYAVSTVFDVISAQFGGSPPNLISNFVPSLVFGLFIWLVTRNRFRRRKES